MTTDDLRDHEARALKAIQTARAKLLIGKDMNGRPNAHFVFFGRLAMSLRLVVDWTQPTAWTDGKRLGYNPSFINSLNAEGVRFVVAHEVLHPALSHQLRRDGREPILWNIAADLAINWMLQEAGFTVWEHACLPGREDFETHDPRWCAEEHYAHIPKDIAEQWRGKGQDPGKCGGVIDGTADRDPETGAGIDPVTIAQAAAAARQIGKLSAALEGMISELLDPQTPWTDELADFITRSIQAQDDFTWRRPSKRHTARGFYLPSMRGETMGTVIVTLDSSGSVDTEMLRLFCSELNGVIDAKPTKIIVINHDSDIAEPYEWEPSQGRFTEVAIHKRGGTDHRPIWDWIQEHEPEAACCICLTDGCTSYGQGPHGVPVLWALPEAYKDTQPPFGRKIILKEAA